MITISSVAVSPLPPQAPTVKAQPVMPVKPSNAVSPENAGVSVVVSQGMDGGRAVGVYAPPSLPPVTPADQAVKADMPNNPAVPEKMGNLPAAAMASAALGATRTSEPADPANEAAEPTAARPAGEERVRRTEAELAERRAQTRAERQRFQGELPAESKSPVDEAMDQQINDLLPNMWKASRAAVDVLIGEEARAAAAARAEVLAPQPEVPSERALEATENYQRVLADPPAPGAAVDQRV